MCAHEGAGAGIGAGDCPLVNEGGALVALFAVDEGIQGVKDLLAGDGRVHFAPPIPYSAATSAREARRFLRALLRRLMTVPMGTPSSSAISL